MTADTITQKIIDGRKKLADNPEWALTSKGITFEEEIETLADIKKLSAMKRGRIWQKIPDRSFGEKFAIAFDKAHKNNNALLSFLIALDKVLTSNNPHYEDQRRFELDYLESMALLRKVRRKERMLELDPDWALSQEGEGFMEREIGFLDRLRLQISHSDSELSKREEPKDVSNKVGLPLANKLYLRRIAKQKEELESEWAGASSEWKIGKIQTIKREEEDYWLTRTWARGQIGR